VEEELGIIRGIDQPWSGFQATMVSKARGQRQRGGGVCELIGEEAAGLSSVGVVGPLRMS
jgi:hypothetical protein